MSLLLMRNIITNLNMSVIPTYGSSVEWHIANNLEPTQTYESFSLLQLAYGCWQTWDYTVAAFPAV